jgi:hypothetical protein
MEEWLFKKNKKIKALRGGYYSKQVMGLLTTLNLKKKALSSG